MFLSLEPSCILRLSAKVTLGLLLVVGASMNQSAPSPPAGLARACLCLLAGAPVYRRSLSPSPFTEALQGKTFFYTSLP